MVTTASPQEPSPSEEVGELPMSWERPVPVERPAIRFPEGARAYRAHVRRVGASLVTLSVLLVPFFVVLCLVLVWMASRSSYVTIRLGPALGILVAGVTVAYAGNWLALLGNRHFERAMRALVAERLGRDGGALVSVATPEASAYRVHLEGHSDVGLLFEDADGLVFEGLRERLVIARADVLELSLTRNWQFVHVGALWCVVRYRVRDHDDERTSTLRILSRRDRTLRRNVTATRDLHARLQRWHAASSV